MPSLPTKAELISEEKAREIHKDKKRKYGQRRRAREGHGQRMRGSERQGQKETL